ncbi:MAG: hypothetical protein KGO22_21865 [Gammaproteobacteria bacterium]|nr:hypothetical protein [Gammaproteobacteria bacterium]
MRNSIVRSAGAALLLATSLAACGKLGFSSQPQHSTHLPTARELKEIRYMSQTQAAGPDGRHFYDRFEQAKSCHDFEIAMRWNRPPDLRGGPFNDKMVYVSGGVPADLPKNSEVFLAGVIRAGRALPTGGSIWSLKLKDGSELQAIETTEYAQKQEEAQQEGGHATMIHPYTPRRMLCAYGVYQGNIGLAMDNHGHVPLVSILFAMDRIR